MICVRIKYAQAKKLHNAVAVWKEEKEKDICISYGIRERGRKYILIA